MSNELAGMVFLTAYLSTGEIVEEETLTFDDYYSESHPLIDENDYRLRRAIRRIVGKVHDLEGHLDQEFENFYSENGEYISGRVIHRDGTIIEN